MMHLRPTTQTSQAGFGLIELLTSILVIGVIAMLVTTIFSSQYDRARPRDLRNAQALAAICAAAQAAGIDPIISNDVMATANQLRVGVRPTTGMFHDQTFKVSGIANEDIAGAIRFLRIERGQLLYASDITR